GVLADDGTDRTALPDADNPDRTYRTFIRDTGPRFVVDPVAGTQACALGSRDVIDGAVVGQGLAFSFEDGNGAETVTITVTYAAREADVFDAPGATLVLDAVPAGTDPVEVVIFLEALEPSECLEFVHGIGFYGVELDDGVNDPVQQAADYLGPPLGACCSTDGFCEDLLEAECLDGIYQGDTTSCSTFECPILTGACCLADGSCTDDLEDRCVLLKGTYQGTGTTCATIGCPPPPPPPPPTVFDCNSNGVPDDEDIASGFSHDCNLNGVPDECEGVGNVVDAGTLNNGTIVDGVYDSASNNNNLEGFICPVLSPQSVRWSTVSVPVGGTNTFITYTDQSSLTTAFFINGAIPGEYVIQLFWNNQEISDTVTLTLQP
ncbi:MAG: hypothetical protein IID40_11800, partial [Planctomycetes bacterium]|nr:hypothetical protein [Planctomycetota bacterium]